MDSNNAFSVLMKKPLLKSAKDDGGPGQVFDCEVSEADKENNGDREHSASEIKTPTNTKESDVKASIEPTANTSSTKVNAFSRLMAPRGKNKNDGELEEGGERQNLLVRNFIR